MMAACSLLYIVLCMHLPMGMFADAGYDDALFSAHAALILSGHWLGNFDLETLVKGPGYPLFLVLNAILGVPVTLSQALLYSFACCLTATTLYRLTGSALLAAAVFLAILFHPCVFPTRLTRDDISPAQVLLVLACVLRFARLAGTWRQVLGWAVAGGLLFGWYWMTREDVVWVVPGLALLLLGRLLRCRLARLPLLPVAGGTAAFLAAACFAWCAVAGVNWARYGSFEVVDIKSPQFVRALHALQTVRVGAAQAYVPVPAKVRRAVDKVSPAFAALEPYFNGPGLGWTQYGCAILQSTCGDYAGGWFIFALRSAVAWKGDYNSPRQSEAYFREIADQVAAACADGRLTCKPTLSSLMPAVTKQQWRTLPNEIRQLYDMLMLRDPLELASLSTGDPQQMAAMEQILNRPRRLPTQYDLDSVAVTGWFYPKDGSWLQIVCSSPGHERIIPIVRLPSPDVAAFFKNPALTYDRFNFVVPGDKSCMLQSTLDPGGTLQNLRNIKPGELFTAHGPIFYGTVQPLLGGMPGAGAQSVLQGLRLIYRAVLPVAAIAAVACYLWHLAALLRRRRLGDFIIPATALWLLVLTRCLVLLLVDISAFPAITQLYMLPGFPLSCMAIAFSIALPFLREGEAASPTLPAKA